MSDKQKPYEDKKYKRMPENSSTKQVHEKNRKENRKKNLDQ